MPIKGIPSHAPAEQGTQKRRNTRTWTRAEVKSRKLKSRQGKQKKANGPGKATQASRAGEGGGSKGTRSPRHPKHPNQTHTPKLSAELLVLFCCSSPLVVVRAEGVVWLCSPCPPSRMVFLFLSVLFFPFSWFISCTYGLVGS